MDNNILKTPVFTENILMKETAEVPIDVNFTLPDYAAEIVKIFKCIVTPRISSKNISGGKLDVEGCFWINVIYSNGEGRLCAYEYQSPFSRSFELPSGNDGLYVTAKIKTEYINCRPITERRIDIHGAASIIVCGYERKMCELVSDYDDNDIELKRAIVPATTPMGTGEKALLLEEEIEIGQAQPAICSMLRYETSALIRECKLLNEKAIIKGELTVTVLYCSDAGKIQSVRATLPFSQLIEMAGAGESCECNATVSLTSIEIKPRTNISGEARSLSMSAKLNIAATAFCECEIEAVLDAYSRKNQLETEKTDIHFKKISNCISDTVKAKDELSFGDITLSGVSDIWGDIAASSVKFTDDEMQLEGKVNVCAVVTDENGKPQFYERALDFTYAYPLGEIKGGECDPDLEIKNLSYTLLGNNRIEVRIEIGLYACVYSGENIKAITSVSKGSPYQSEVDKGALAVYFAAAGEHIWDIARRYRSSVEEICEINDIAADVLTEEKMIIVPMI